MKRRKKTAARTSRTAAKPTPAKASAGRKPVRTAAKATAAKKAVRTAARGKSGPTRPTGPTAPRSELVYSDVLHEALARKLIRPH